MQVLYITDIDRQPFGTAAVSVPYSHLVEVPGMQKEDRWKMTETVEQIMLAMSQSDRLEVRGVLSFQTCVMQQCRFENVTDITGEPYDQEEYKKRPGMVIHFVQPKETLWSIAKNQHSTVEEIKRLNELTADEVVPGQKLLLLKSMGDAVL